MTGVHERVGAWTFPPRPESVPTARRAVRDLLVELDATESAGDATLVVSELVTNALVHAGTDITVVLRAAPGGWQVEVTDGSPHRPSMRSYGATASTGRGLALLNEVARSWGVRARPSGAPGKVVWCVLPDRAAAGALSRPGRARVRSAVRAGAGRSADGGHAAGRGADRAAGTVVVRYLDVPLLLVHAWRQHAESLLRELLLVSMDHDVVGGSAMTSIDVHAAASDAIALLTEHLPDADWWEAGAELLDDTKTLLPVVAEPAASLAEVRVPVPASSVPSFEVLDQALERAITLARADDLLITPTQPEVHDLRRWLCDQVVHQRDGGAPVPWTPRTRGDGAGADSRAATGSNSAESLTGWDAGPVTGARRAVLAADETSRIVAASTSACELLGYPATWLVGARVTDVIPVRFRQAHVAGFTLHFLTGRGPLLEGPLRAPVLRSDGREVEVLITIDRQRSATGAPVFVAVLDPVGG